MVKVDNVPNPDTVLLAGTIVYPANGQTVSDTVAVRVVASDNDSVSTVCFFLDGDTVHQASESPYIYNCLHLILMMIHTQYHRL